MLSSQSHISTCSGVCAMLLRIPGWQRSQNFVDNSRNHGCRKKLCVERRWMCGGWIESVARQGHYQGAYQTASMVDLMSTQISKMSACTTCIPILLRVTSIRPSWQYHLVHLSPALAMKVRMMMISSRSPSLKTSQVTQSLLPWWMPIITIPCIHILNGQHPYFHLLPLQLKALGALAITGHGGEMDLALLMHPDPVGTMISWLWILTNLLLKSILRSTHTFHWIRARYTAWSAFAAFWHLCLRFLLFLHCFQCFACLCTWSMRLWGSWSHLPHGRQQVSFTVPPQNKVFLHAFCRTCRHFNHIRCKAAQPPSFYTTPPPLNRTE